MPTMRETAINKPLSGLELRDLIRADCERLLANEGSLSAHIAYGRVGYQLILRLQTGNPMMPATEIEIKSKPRVDIPALEPVPLGGEGVTTGGTTVQRTVTSPNAERVREGLPVPIEVRQQDGTKTVERVVYPKPADMGDGNVAIVDSTADAKQTFGR